MCVYRTFLFTIFLLFEFTLTAICREPIHRQFSIDYPYAEKQRIEIDPNLLGDCLTSVTQRGGPYYFVRDNMSYGYTYNEFLDYLSVNDGYRSYNTGKEPDLFDWILSQPDNSIDPVSLYSKSLEFNEGNVWNAILTVHQLLRNQARWWDSNNYFYRSSPEQEERFFKKMIDIRGDLTQRGAGFTGDHGGSWYRIWGIMLFRMMQENEQHPGTPDAYCHVPQTGVGPGLDQFKKGMKSVLIASAAEWPKMAIVGWPEADGRKGEINRMGARTMNQMLSRLWGSESGHNQQIDWKKCQERKYLIPVNESGPKNSFVGK